MIELTIIQPQGGAMATIYSISLIILRRDYRVLLEEIEIHSGSVPGKFGNPQEDAQLVA